MAGEPLQTFTLTDAARVLRGRPCIIVGGEAYNVDAATRFIQIFDATATTGITLGTTPNYKFLAVSPGDNDHLELGNGLSIANGIVAAATTGPTNATGATAVHLSLVIS